VHSDAEELLVAIPAQDVETILEVVGLLQERRKLVSAS
jgi:hypothetical protein